MVEFFPSQVQGIKDGGGEDWETLHHDVSIERRAPALPNEDLEPSKYSMAFSKMLGAEPQLHIQALRRS